MSQKSLVLRAVKNTPSFPRISLKKLDIFCTDIVLVALGFRTAYLLDLFSISETSARRFDAVLRKEDAAFRTVLIIFHTELEQVFFVNASLLHDRHVEAQSLTPWTSFIYLTPDLQDVPESLTEIHTVSQTILGSWNDQSSTFHTCISSLSPPQMIAFAGYLLEYPVSYYPTVSSQNSFLRDVPLEVYECTLVHITPNLPRHFFMKFSRPAGLGNSSSALADKIHQRFEQRFCQLPPDWKEIKVTFKTRTMDRVAL